MTELNHPSEASIFYLDVNLATSQYGVTQLAKNVSRGSPIIYNPSKYYCAIARCVIPTSFSIWLWQPVLLNTSNMPVGTNPALCDGYNTVYQISLRSTGANVSSSVYLRLPLQQADATTVPPPTPVTIQPTNGWGAIYSYDTIVEMLTIGIQDAYKALVGLDTTLSASLPYYSFNSQSSLFTLHVYPYSQWYSNDLVNPEGVQLFFNNESRTPFLQGWRYSRLNNNVGTNGLDCQVLMMSDGTNWLEYGGVSYTLPPAPPTNVSIPSDPTMAQLNITQGWACSWSFNSVGSIQIVSSLPTQPEQTDLPLYLQGIASNNQTTSILCDFCPDYSSSSSAWQEPLIYTPSSVIPGARYIQLVGSNPVSDFTIGIFWVDNYGIQRPVQVIAPNVNASIKLVFVRRSLIDNSFDDITGNARLISSVIKKSQNRY